MARSKASETKTNADSKAPVKELDSELIEAALEACYEIRKGLASNPNAPAELLRALSWDAAGVRANVVRNPNTPEDVVRILAADENDRVRGAFAERADAPEDLLRELAANEESHTRMKLAANPPAIMQPPKRQEMNMTRSSISLKAILALCMATLVALAITGCGSSSSSSAASSTSASSEASSSASSESASSEASADTSADKAGGKSSASSSKSASATSASAASSSSVATGQLVDVKNEATGYTFKTDKGYKVKYDGSDTLVYTSATEGAVPWFAFRIMKNATGQSVEDFLTKYGNDAVKEYKDKIVVEPVANTVKIGDRTIKGIEYVRLNDKGDKKIAVMEYVDTNNSGNLLIWNTICYQTDVETPAAMQTAMETFKWLAG